MWIVNVRPVAEDAKFNRDWRNSATPWLKFATCESCHLALHLSQAQAGLYCSWRIPAIFGIRQRVYGGGRTSEQRVLVLVVQIVRRIDADLFCSNGLSVAACGDVVALLLLTKIGVGKGLLWKIRDQA
jgi:hypothetical protein